MKAFIFVLATIVSTSAFAGENYRCVGKDGRGKRAELEVSFGDLKAAQVVDLEGDEHELAFQKVTTKGKVFADYDYDGYGGFLELTVPRDFAISGSNAAEEFKAQYRQEIYSEAGHVGSVKFSGVCQRTDN